MKYYFNSSNGRNTEVIDIEIRKQIIASQVGFNLFFSNTSITR